MRRWRWSECTLATNLAAPWLIRDVARMALLSQAASEGRVAGLRKASQSFRRLLADEEDMARTVTGSLDGDTGAIRSTALRRSDGATCRRAPQALGRCRFHTVDIGGSPLLVHVGLHGIELGR